MVSPFREERWIGMKQLCVFGQNNMQKLHDSSRTDIEMQAATKTQSQRSQLIEMGNKVIVICDGLMN